MEEYRFLDDQEYAQLWVKARRPASPLGEEKLPMSLNLGVSQEIVESALTL